jgi:hypothetical protein
MVGDHHDAADDQPGQHGGGDEPQGGWITAWA